MKFKCYDLNLLHSSSVGYSLPWAFLLCFRHFFYRGLLFYLLTHTDLSHTTASTHFLESSNLTLPHFCVCYYSICALTVNLNNFFLMTCLASKVRWLFLCMSCLPEQITFLNARDYCFLTTTCSDCYTMQLAGMFDKDLLANIWGKIFSNPSWL